MQSDCTNLELCHSLVIILLFLVEVVVEDVMVVVVVVVVIAAAAAAAEVAETEVVAEVVEVAAVEAVVVSLQSNRVFLWDGTRGLCLSKIYFCMYLLNLFLPFYQLYLSLLTSDRGVLRE